MYIPGDQPEQVESLLALYHEACGTLPVPACAQPLSIFPGSRCEDIVPAGHIAWLEQGSVDLKLGERVAMILQAGDFFMVPDLEPRPLSYESEESGILRIAPLADLEVALEDDGFASLLVRVLLLQVQLLSLAYAHANRYGMRPTAGFARHRAGTVLITRGSAADSVYTLMRGQARVELDGITVGSVEEGEIFGVLSALVQSPHTANVIAETDVTVMSVPSNEFIRLIQAQPETFMRLLRTLSRHIGELNQRLVEAIRNPDRAAARQTGRIYP